MSKIDLKNAVVKLVDGAATELEIKVGEGTLAWTETRNMEYSKDRGLLDTVREGDEDPLALRIDMVWEFLRGTTGSAGVPSPYEALTKTGVASTWTSSSADPCEPYAVDVVVVYTPPCSSRTETITFPDFRFETIDGDARAGTLAVAGHSNAKSPTLAA
jgi:hypothetical protein